MSEIKRKGGPLIILHYKLSIYKVITYKQLCSITKGDSEPDQNIA